MAQAILSKAATWFAHDTEKKSQGSSLREREPGLVFNPRGVPYQQSPHDRNRSASCVVNSNFVAPKPNSLWVADITYIPMWGDFSFWPWCSSRKIIGWAMESHLRTPLVTAALAMALEQRSPEGGVIHHPDQGCQYTSIEFGKRCREANVRPSMGSVGDCYHNSMYQSFFATRECEL